jgi:hypothetical protein
MFVVVEYFNYRKNITVNLVAYTSDETVAKEKAYQLAYDMYDGHVLDLKEYCRNQRVFDQYVFLEGEIVAQYSNRDGYDRMIYAVVEVPELLPNLNNV